MTRKRLVKRGESKANILETSHQRTLDALPNTILIDLYLKCRLFARIFLFG